MPTPRRFPRIARHAAALLVALAAGSLCAWARTPIPWMLGPLFSLAALRIAGAPLEAPRYARHVGQWVIGTALGLYFTPVVLRHVGHVWYLPAAGAVFSLLVGYATGRVLARLARLDQTTCIFCCVPGGAAEMATLGERFGARVDRVAAAQSLRILLVVLTIPFAFQWAGVHGSDAYAPGVTAFDPPGFAALMAATLLGCAVAQRYRVPNAFVLGALAVAIPLTAMEIHLSSIPAPVSNAGQLLLGSALGSRFRRDFLQGAPRFVAAVVLAVFVTVALTSAFGAALAWASGQNAATLILGTSPGGVAEMAITAKVLRLGVPLVTSFHVLRLVVLLLGTAPLYRLLRQWRHRKATQGTP